MRTRGFLDVDETTRQVHSFVCVNTLMTDEEGRRLIKEMKKKYSAIISEAELSALESDVPAVENPSNLERAILNLITNLNNPAMCGDYDPSMSDSSSISEAVERKPSLSIIAPEVKSIKPSIVRAVDVLGPATKVKQQTSLKIKDEPKSPEPHTNSTSVKMEPLSNVMSSPASSSSSMSSVDPLSPYSSSSSSTTTTTNIPSTNTTATTNRFTSFDENHHQQHNQSKQILHEATGAISVITSTGDSMISSNNNNNKNNSRSSVLKRTHSKIDDDYTDEIIKKRVVSSYTSNKLDSFIESPQTSNAERQSFALLESSDAGEKMREN